MIELKRDNAHKIVATEEQAQSLIYDGFEIVAPKEEKIMTIEDFNLTEEIIDNMGVLEMKDIAKALKVKGYTNMGKTSLTKSLKELIEC